MTEIKNNMDLSVSYRGRIQNRSYWRFFLGLIPRFISKIKYDRNVSIARRRGATIGNNVTIIRSLAKKEIAELFCVECQEEAIRLEQ